MSDSLHCYVYKGSRQVDHFLYLPEKLPECSAEDAEPNSLNIPAALLTLLGELTLVVDFELTPDRFLAQADANLVLADIRAQGFYLQMPKTSVEELEAKLNH